ncbi:MAG: nitroreductase [Gammaproteobacteria bacterium]
MSRTSVRRFLPRDVSEAQIRQLLEVAARAPSGTNTQPWKVYVVCGPKKEAMSDAIVAAYDDPDVAVTHSAEYDYYPTQWVSPYIDRRRKVGWDLYSLLGIEKGDKARMHAQHARNYRFFDAPAGLIFTIDRIMEKGSWLDYGMFLQNVMVAARGHGLHTCPQASFNQFHRIIAEHLGIPDKETMVCGMSLGYADEDAIEFTLTTERAPLEQWATFC